MDEKEIEALGMGAFMSVTRGSDQPGKLIIISYKSYLINYWNQRSTVHDA